MKPLTTDELKGTWGTLLLPVNADNSFDFALLEDELDYLCASGVSGIYSNGTAGEFFNQTEAEFDRISLLLSEKCKQAGIPFQIGASHMSPTICLERIRRSRALSPGGFQVILPDWVAANPREQVIFLQGIAEAAWGIPLILYNPGHAKTALTPADFKRLAEAVPELIGIKVAGGGPDWYADMASLNTRLSVFVPGHRLATGINSGVARGAYSNIACINPAAAQRWYLTMLDDIETALDLENRINHYFRLHILPLHQEGYCDAALDKFLAAIGGWMDIGTRLRWPYQGVDPQKVGPARNAAMQILPELFN